MDQHKGRRGREIKKNQNQGREKNHSRWARKQRSKIDEKLQKEAIHWNP
jgi:hypothetical protein